MSAWTYSQRSGELRDPDGTLIEVGYAGSEPFVNRPLAERREDQGPLPTGTYTIGAARDDDQMGPCCLPLEPAADNEMHDRYGFYIHGDTTPPGNASTGCIIMSRDTRDLIDASDERELVVIV